MIGRAPGPGFAKTSGSNEASSSNEANKGEWIEMLRTIRIVALWLTVAWLIAMGGVARAEMPVGTRGRVGPPEGARIVNRLEVTKPGVYENLIVDGDGASGNLVKIKSDHVTIRDCEIRNARGNGIGVFGTHVLIENCRIHHLLAGTFQDQQDAHGITGRWGDVTIRNCDISYTSGDAIQFDPDRQSSGSVVIENCRLWTGPLPETVFGYRAGERPGENGVDTKTKPDGARCQLKLRNCYLFGWNQPSPISNNAALNLKENVDAEVIRCVFDDNEIALRIRGPGGRGGAHVTITDCAIFRSTTGIRVEDKVETLGLNRLAFGDGVAQRIRFVNGGPTAGFRNENEQVAAPLKDLLRLGFDIPEN
jgi:hypothetical protein